MNDVNSTESRPSYKAVYTIVERQGSQKKFWVRIGNAFINRDESLSVRLDAMPVNGNIHIRDVHEDEYERFQKRKQDRAMPAPVTAFGGAA